MSTYFFRIPKNARSLPASSGDLSTLAAGTDLVVAVDFAEVDEGAGEGLVVLAPEEEDMMLSVCYGEKSKI